MIRPSQHSRGGALRVVLMAVGGVVAVLVGGWVFVGRVPPSPVGRWRAEMVGELGTAEDFARLRGVTEERLGALIVRPDGTWVAIAYRDTHTGRIRSCAVAVDSEGKWMESEYHFCAGLAEYGHLRQDVEDMEKEMAEEKDPKSRAETEDWLTGWTAALHEHFLYGVEAAPTLGEARGVLAKNHFVVAGGLPRPQLAGVSVHGVATETAPTGVPASP